jgi:hypothetical protein
VKVVVDAELADGQKTHTEFTAKYDGKDYPISGSASADTVSLRRTGSGTVERMDKKAGKVVQTSTRQLAPDGKTFTVTVPGTDAQGKPITTVIVFEKQ